MKAGQPTVVGLATFKPLILLVVFSTIFAVLPNRKNLTWMTVCMSFCAIFLAGLSWLKLVNLEKFAKGAFSRYHPIAMHWQPFGFIFPFIELGLACVMTSGWWHWGITVLIGVLYGLDAVGVTVALVQGKKLECGCMGVISLPLSWVTVVEDLVMIGMCVSMDVVGAAMEYDYNGNTF